VESVTGECANVLRITPSAGRPISAADAPVIGDGAPVALISHRLWQAEFGGASDVVGRALRVEGQPLTIIGVLPASYRGLNADEAPDIALPLATMWKFRGGRVLALHLVGRLKDGVTLAQARAHLRTVWPAAWVATNPAGLPPAATRASLAENLRVDSLTHGFSTLRFRFAQPLRVAVGLAALLVVLACINVGALLLSRTMARESEIAVLMALGASRGRLAANVAGQGMALAFVAALVAMPVAWWVSQLVAAIAWTGSRPLTMSVTPTATTTAVFALVTLLAGTISSFPPAAWVLSRNFPLAASHGRGVLAGTRRWRRALVGAQVSISFALMFCAALLVGNLARLQQLHLGYSHEGLRWTRLAPVPGGARVYDFDSYTRSLLDAVAALPQVEQVALANAFPSTEVRHTTAQFPIERVGRADGGSTRGMMDRVSPGFFNTVGIRLLGGREFDWTDALTAPPVAMLTKPLADRLFPDGNAVGQQIRVPGRTPQDLTVVGLVDDFSPGDPRIRNVARIYIPMMQEPRAVTAPAVLIRVRDDRDLLSAVRGAVTPLGRHDVSMLASIADQTNRFLTQERLLSGLSIAFGFIGILVGGLGLYAMLAHSVATRAREIGLRMALGSTRRGACALIASEGVLAVAVGVAGGAPLAVAAGTTVRTLLFEGSGANGFALMAAVVSTLLAAAVAALVPSLHAARTDPAVALRTE
jgi:predicted permease